MEIQIERPPLTTQVDSLAFLSDRSEDSVLQAPNTAETETHPRRSPSPHPPAALPAPHLPSGTLRRRNSYIVAAANSDHGGTNDGRALGSLATNSQLTSSSSVSQLPLLMLHELRLYHRDAPFQEMTSNVSPSCSRAVLHKLLSARSGSGGSGIPRLPFP